MLKRISNFIPHCQINTLLKRFKTLPVASQYPHFAFVIALNTARWPTNKACAVGNALAAALGASEKIIGHASQSFFHQIYLMS